MATTTTYYGFDIPQSSDLVKDGATAIATLGQDIDTAMNTALGTKKSGLVLLNTTSFSGVSSVSLPADIFTSTYRNYFLLMTGVGSSATETDLFLRFRASGSDNSTANYSRWTYNRGGAAGNAQTLGATSHLVGSCANGGFQLIADILQPKVVANTILRATGHGYGSTSSMAYWVEAQFTATTSFDSCSIFPGSGTITGQYSVYARNE